MKKTRDHELSLREKKKIQEAMKSYREMWEEIKPFVKKQPVKRYTTRGEWKHSSHE
jgi:hypothetical protein